jgi:hypothetical protein
MAKITIDKIGKYSIGLRESLQDLFKGNFTGLGSIGNITGLV